MITITGATGKTGSAVTTMLIEKGMSVRAVGRSAERLDHLYRNDVEFAPGDQGDVNFLTKAFTGSDAVYLLIPPKADAADLRQYYNELGNVAVTALRRAGIRKVVFLSSLGADKPAGTGPVVGLYDVEQKLKTLRDVDIVFLRPGYFMENTLGTMGLIHEKGINGASMPPDVHLTLAATRDIGAKAAELLMNRSFTGHTVVEIMGDRLTFAEITSVIGNAVGMPHLPYIQFSDADTVAMFMSMGLSSSVARSYSELMHGVANGLFGSISGNPELLTAPTRYAQFVEEVFKPAFMAEEHHVTA